MYDRLILLPLTFCRANLIRACVLFYPEHEGNLEKLLRSINGILLFRKGFD